MLHDKSGIKISNLEELALALDSKLDRVNITNEASTEITIPGNLPQSEIQNRGEWKVPSQKAFLTFYITVNGNKVSYGDISHVYKTASPSIINKYRKPTALTDDELPFSVQGAKAFYTDIKSNLDANTADLEARKVNFVDAIGIVDYYDGTAWVPPNDADITRRYLHHKGAFDMFKFLYEDKIPYSVISELYTDAAATEAAVVENTLKDPKRNVQLKKIASELSVRKLYVKIRNSITDTVTDYTNKFNEIWAFVNKKEKIIDYTTGAINSGVDTALITKANIKVYSSYLITFFYEPDGTESCMQQFRFMIGKTKDNYLHTKIFNLSKMNSNDNEKDIELIYDDAQGLVFQTNFNKTSSSLLKVKLHLEIENQNFM